MKNDNTESIKNSLCDLFRSYGYSRFKVNKFEEYDLYAQNRSFLTSKHFITFSDTDGRLMALKPDVTLSIIKNISASDRLRKLYYTESVYRVPEGGDGFREITQTGLEYIGSLSSAAVAEVLNLAARSLEQISADCVLDISHLGVLSGILDDEGVPPEAQAKIFESVSRKMPHGTAQLCRSLGVSEISIGMINELAGLYGSTGDILPAIEKLPLPRKSRDAVTELKEVCRILSVYGNTNARLDFSLVNVTEYYNGFVFCGYAADVPNAVLSGGCYDGLMRKMNKTQSAIGFAVYLDRLERLVNGKAEYDADTLIVSGGEKLADAIAMAEKLRKDGESVMLLDSMPEGMRFKTVTDMLKEG